MGRNWARWHFRNLRRIRVNLLFLCSRNRLRSPTAEQVFAAWPGVETASAGLAPDAEEPPSAELVEWAETIFVMERAHRPLPFSPCGRRWQAVRPDG